MYKPAIIQIIESANGSLKSMECRAIAQRRVTLTLLGSTTRSFAEDEEIELRIAPSNVLASIAPLRTEARKLASTLPWLRKHTEPRSRNVQNANIRAAERVLRKNIYCIRRLRTTRLPKRKLISASPVRNYCWNQANQHFKLKPHKN